MENVDFFLVFISFSSITSLLEIKPSALLRGDLWGARFYQRNAAVNPQFDERVDRRLAIQPKAVVFDLLD